VSPYRDTQTRVTVPGHSDTLSPYRDTQTRVTVPGHSSTLSRLQSTSCCCYF